MSNDKTDNKFLPLIDVKKLVQLIEKQRNVLFIGNHGVGKTGATKAAFEQAGYKWMQDVLYFSAPTIDPWVDLIGIPRAVLEAATGEYVLEIIPPTRIRNVKAIILDEFNRAPKKVKGALMEMIQFGSINGIKLPQLQMVWAMINPFDEDEGTYDVEPLDEAQKDRFHVHINVEDKPCSHYFVSQYGNIGRGAVEWWEELSADKKKNISPRRLEYVINAHQDRLDIRDFLPAGTNVTKLLERFKDGPIQDRLISIHEARDEEAAKEFMSDMNSFQDGLQHIHRVANAICFFFKHATTEQVVMGMTKYDKIIDFLVRDMDAPGNEAIKEAIRQIIVSDGSPDLIKKIGDVAKKHGKKLPAEIKAPVATGA